MNSDNYIKLCNQQWGKGVFEYFNVCVIWEHSPQVTVVLRPALNAYKFILLKWNLSIADNCQLEKGESVAICNNLFMIQAVPWKVVCYKQISAIDRFNLLMIVYCLVC